MKRILTVTTRYNSRPIIDQRQHASILEGLQELNHVQHVHAQVITSGLINNIYLANKLMNAYASYGLISNARQIFSRISNKNLFSWTILISGLIKNGLFVEAIAAFGGMTLKGVRPNEVTISRILAAFGKLRLSRDGKSVHCYWVRQGFKENVFVETALIDMYTKLGFVTMGRCVFDNMSERNVVTWNTMISGYSENGFGVKAFDLFHLMSKEGILMDDFTAMSLISACVKLDDVKVGRGVHALLIKSGYENDYVVKSSLMKMYISIKFVNDGYCIFNEMVVKDVNTWTIMLTGLCKGGNWKKSMEHFNEMMQVKEMKLDWICLTSILSGCSSFGALQQGKRVHGLAIKSGFECDVFVGSAIIDMYANCGDIEAAKRFFKRMDEKDVVCWNVLIAGSGMNGYFDDAMDLLLKMKDSGVNPNESTFVSVLSACSHAGKIDQGIHIFNQINLKHTHV